VIRHQAVRLATEPIAVRHLAKEHLESAAIGVILENARLPVAPGHDVVNRPSKLNSRTSRHAQGRLQSLGHTNVFSFLGLLEVDASRHRSFFDAFVAAMMQ